MYKRIKKDTKWSIQELGQFNIDNIVNEVSEFNEEWKLDTSRQNIGQTHEATEMFRICATEYDWVPGTEIKTEYVNNFKTDNAKKELLDIYKQLEYYYSGKVIRCELIKLLANRSVWPHIDGGALLAYSRRIHIPLITNDNITFTVMNNSINMKRGVWYEINNQMIHAVDNPTNQDRVHMIIDVLPDDMINYKKDEN